MIAPNHISTLELDPRFELIRRKSAIENHSAELPVSQLVPVVDEIKRSLTQADSDQSRIYLYAIRFRELRNKARQQFEREESSLCFERYLDDAQTNKQASDLIEQHITLLREIESMLEEAERQIQQPSDDAGMSLLNRFWSFCELLRKHEQAEQQLLMAVA